MKVTGVQYRATVLELCPERYGSHAVPAAPQGMRRRPLRTAGQASSMRRRAGGRRGFPDHSWKWVAAVRSGEVRFPSPEIAVPHHLPKALCRCQESGGHPAPDHAAITPAADAADPHANAGLRTLDDIGGRQATMQRRRYIQPVNCKALLDARKLSEVACVTPANWSAARA